jgi:hypothetical protein
MFLVVEIHFAIMIALTASEIADMDPKRNRQGGTGSKPKSRRMGPHGAVGVLT